MQVFLPYPCPIESISSIDPKRLFKGALESQQILKSIICDSGWRNHPVARAFKTNPAYVAAYGVESCNISKTRDGYNSSKIKQNILNLCRQNSIGPSFENPPKWIGNEKIHSSHRSRLLCKGRIDSVCLGIKKHFKIKNINNWAQEKFGKSKNELRFDDLLGLEYFAKDLDIDVPISYYARHGWTDDPSKEYVWPEIVWPARDNQANDFKDVPSDAVLEECDCCGEIIGLSQSIFTGSQVLCAKCVRET